MDIPSQWDWAELYDVCRSETKRILGLSGDRDDAAQEALLRAWRNRSACRSERAPRPWVSQIARREAFRQASRRGAVSAREVALDAADTPLVGPAFDEGALAEALALREAIADLGELDRRLLMLRYVDDLTHQQIADRTAMPVGTVKVRLHRARKRLRAELASAA
jgi:RNA polymerase sigma-70 factor, ECF subfamily